MNIKVDEFEYSLKEIEDRFFDKDQFNLKLVRALVRKLIETEALVIDAIASVELNGSIVDFNALNKMYTEITGEDWE